MKKYFSILRINWIQALEYRANALIGLFAIISGLFIEYQIWSLIFKSKNYKEGETKYCMKVFLNNDIPITSTIKYKAQENADLALYKAGYEI